MKRILFSLLLGLILTLSCFMGIGVGAEEQKSSESLARDIYNGIITYKQENGNIQEWIESALSESAGTGAEWYVLALSQYGEYDFSTYERSLLSYLSDHNVSSFVTRQKYALCLASIGSGNAYIGSVMNDTIGKQGIMSYIFGLHLLNNGYSSTEHTTDSVIDIILSLQLENGGFSVSGDNGDNDITAMAVQALAPYYKDNGGVKDCIDRALAFLSDKQSDKGDFKSYGVYNPESTAQVLIALTSLGIDPASDARFIKNGNDLFDVIEKYRTSDGSFCHTVGGVSNGNATSQVFLSMVSYLRMKDGKAPIYILDNADPESLVTDPPLSDDTSTGGQETATKEENGTQTANNKTDCKTWAIIGIIALGAISALVLLILKKRNIKSFLVIVLAVAAGVILVLVTDIRSPSDYYNGQDIKKENVTGKVSLTVRCDAIECKTEKEHIPEDGIILPLSEFDITDGDTVYRILMEAARKHKIQVDCNGNEKTAYIEGINYIYEFEFGDLSGWIYLVNGVSPSVGCGEYTLSPNDRIEWVYTLDMGKK